MKKTIRGKVIKDKDDAVVRHLLEWKDRINEGKPVDSDVVRCLKQLKSEIGKKVSRYKNTIVEGNYQDGLVSVIYMIDKKIKAITKANK